MQRQKRTPTSFKSKLIVYNLIIVIGIASFISFYNYHSYRKDVIETEKKNSLDRVQNISKSLETAYNEMLNIVLNCTERNSMFLSMAKQHRDTAAGKYIRIYASDILRDYCAVSGYNKYIAKIILYINVPPKGDVSGEEIILQNGFISGEASDIQNLMATEWFFDLLNEDTTNYQLSLVDSPFKYMKSQKFLPLIRPLSNNSGQSVEDAWVFLGISTRLFDNQLAESPTEKPTAIITADGTCVSSVNMSQPVSNALVAELQAKEYGGGTFTYKLDKEDYIVSYYKQLRSGLISYELLPLHSLSIDKRTILQTITFIFLSSFAIGISLSLIISSHLGKPISRLVFCLSEIAKGNFTPDPSIETDDEIGIIGKQINVMSTQISTLMESRLETEKEKRHLEINMLQAQINPHFLYNTLDSIKWIATMQKSSGIVSIVTALSSLLKNMAKGFNEKVTLQQEINFVNDYIIIEKIRYIELFDVDIAIEDERLSNAKIIKLTLQPLVENAIFSGIEPSGRQGLIKIRAYSDDRNLYIVVEDNGIGISKENITKLLTNTDRITKSNMSGIGLPNVERRLKLVYGEEYGLTIESKMDEYTRITIKAPLEFDE